MDTALLQYHMRKNGNKQEDLAKALGFSNGSALSARMNGHVEFRKNEIDIITARYNLTADDMNRIFFAIPSACDANKREGGE